MWIPKTILSWMQTHGTKRLATKSRRRWDSLVPVERLEERRVLSAGGTEQILLSGNEPEVAVDPNNPLVVAVAQFTTVRFSTDGGLTFNPSVTVSAPNGYSGFGGDITVNFDSSGNLYLGYLASAPGNRAAVFAAVLDPQTGNILQNQLVADVTATHTHDKEWVAADKWVNSPFRDNAYLIWTQLGDGSPVLFSRTTDGGANWSAALTLDGDAGDGFKWPSEVAVAQNGDVWGAWHTHSDEGNPLLGGIEMRYSSDGGQTFQPEVEPFPDGTASITDNDSSAGHAVIPGLLSWTLGSMQPRVLLDPVRPNNIYVIAVDDPDNNFTTGDPADIVMARSTDYGATWTRSTISHAPLGTAQVFPTGYIDENGNLAVTWYDNRSGNPSVGPDQIPGNGDDNLLLDVYATVSLDGGLTFSPDFKINETQFDPDLGPPTDRFPPNFVFRIGEYHGNEVDSGYASIAWVTNQGNSQSIAFDVFSLASAFPDRFESNDTRSTATNLGSPDTLNLDDLTIDPGDSANDVDFYRVRALQTGTLDVGIRFLHRAGNLDLQIQDKFGNTIASSTSTDDNEEVVIPVVGGQDYFVRVSGVSGNTNSYSLELSNDAAPVPEDVDLDRDDDSGKSDLDNVTYRTSSVHYFVHVDLSELANQGITILTPAQAAAGVTPGAAVQVFDNGVSVGFASAVAGTDNTLFQINFDSDLVNFANGGPNAAGPLGYLGFSNFVLATVKIFDGQKNAVGDPAPAVGRSLLGDRLAVTADNIAPLAPTAADLLPSSDSGINSDNITSVTAPAFQGTAEANTKVTIRANGLVVGQGVVGTDASDGVLGNGLGTWEVTVEPLKAGSYDITASVEDAAGNIGPQSTLLSVTIVAPFNAGPGGAFTAATDYLVGKSPRGVSLGDVDGDGLLDMVVANTSASSISVRLGNASGTFGAATTFASGGKGPNTVALEDLDGINGLDLVVANRASNKVSVFLNTGAGVGVVPFDPLTVTSFATGKLPVSVKLEDINGDTITDLVTANSGGHSVSVLLGNGDGTFTTPAIRDYKTGGRTSRDLLIADFNQDGHNDVVVANVGSKNVSFFAGTGDPDPAALLAAPTRFAVGSQPTSITVTDFNADGNLDIAVTNQRSNNISVLLGNGNVAPEVQFQEQLRIHLPGSKSAETITVGDFDLDGNMDLAIANRKGNTLSILLGTGTGAFTNPFNFSVGDVRRRQPVSIAVGDFNGDSFLDVIVVNAGTNDVSVLLRNTLA